jgi:hypothetical protein
MTDNTETKKNSSQIGFRTTYKLFKQILLKKIELWRLSGKSLRLPNPSE